MATRKRSTGTRKRAGTKRSSSKAEVAGPVPGITAAERRKMAQEEARWRAQSDLETLRRAEEIRRDATRLARAAKVATEEMKALQAVRALRRAR